MWQAVMFAFVPISLACKRGNTKCQAKYSSNNRIITAAPGNSRGANPQCFPPYPKKTKQQHRDQWLSWWGGSTQETRYKHNRNMLTGLPLLTEPWLNVICKCRCDVWNIWLCFLMFETHFFIRLLQKKWRWNGFGLWGIWILMVSSNLITSQGCMEMSF